MKHPLHQFHFCPKCGSEQFIEHNQKSKQCQACGFTYYFNPSAATVAFIVRQTPSTNTSQGREGLGGGFELLTVRRAKEPAKGTLDLPGGFCDMFETGEEGMAREVKEETGLDVEKMQFLFSIPNQYLYSNFLVHTIDMFFLCYVPDTTNIAAMDDASDAQWIRLQDISPEDFGLTSVRRGLEKFLANFTIYIRYKWDF